MKPSQIARIIPRLMSAQIPYFVWGPVGAGKSETEQQACDKIGIELRDVRLAQMDPTDVKGFPCPDLANNVMRWLPPEFFPTEGEGHLFLDEMNSAPQMVQAVSYQLVLTRRIGNYVLPPGWSVAAAGNRAGDRSIVNRQPAALANRFVHLDFEVDVKDWVAYAISQNVNPVIIALIRFKNDLLHQFDETQNPREFPTPRGWFKVDRIMQLGLARQDEKATVQGTIGQGACTELYAFQEMMNELPSMDDIKKDPAKAIIPDQPGAQHAITTTLGMSTDTTLKFNKFMAYVTRLPVEFQAVYVQDSVTRCPKVAHDQAFTDWNQVNYEMLLS